MGINNYKILAIDDNLDNLITIEAVIKNVFPKAVVLKALSGREGIDIAREEDPDVILLDVIMPQMDGFEVCRRLKNDADLKTIPVLFLTAIKTNRETRSKAIEAGGDAFLSKPVDETELLVQVQSMAKIKRGNIMQIKENKRLGALVEEQAYEYSMILNTAMDGFLIIDKRGKVVNVNDTYCNLTGYTRAELLTMSVSDVELLEDKVMTEQRMERVLRNGSERFETKHKCKDGTVIDVEISTSFLNGAESCFYVFVRDITEYKREHERVIETERSKTSILSNIPGFAYRCKLDENWTMEVLSNSFKDIIGYHEDEVIDNRVLSYNEMIVEKYRSEVWDAWNICIQKKSAYKGEYELIKKNGERIWVWEQGHGVYDDNGNVIALEGFVSDITEKKKSEEEKRKMEARLSQQQRLESIGVLAGGVAHEINNPINGIMNYSQLILDEPEKDIEIAEYAKEIIHESERVSEIVKNLLLFSRTDKQSYSNVKIDDIIGRTLSLIRTIIKRDQIDLQVDISKNMPNIKCRSQRLQQVLMNLLTNARDALNQKYEGYDENKVMRISCKTFKKENKDWIRITVEDKGNGIPEAARENIFDPFFSTKGRTQGTGLGLYISYGIAKEHHGELTFETQEGSYARFFLDLPVGDDELEENDNGTK